MKRPPHPWTLRQLQYVITVADLGHFGRAAKACAVSQPSLSNQVAQVESALGTKLFERRRPKVLLTEPGRVFIAAARDILRQADELVRNSQRLLDPFAGEIRLGIIPTMSPYRLPSYATTLRRAYPKLSQVWTEDRTAALIEQMQSGALDGAVLALEAELGPVEVAILGTEEFVFAARLDHPLGGTDAPIDLETVEAAEVLILADGHCFGEQAAGVCQRVGLQTADLRATSLPTLVQIVAAGDSVTLLPEMAVPFENRYGQLSIRQIRGEPVPSRTIALVWRQGSTMGDLMTGLAEQLRTSNPLQIKRIT